MFDGDLFSNVSLNTIYIYSVAAIDKDLTTLGLELTNSREDADLFLNEDQFFIDEQSSFSWDELIENLEQFRSIVEFKRLEKRILMSQSLELDLIEKYKSDDVSLSSYWRFLRLCYETSLEYQSLDEILYRVSRNTELKKLIDIDLYDNEKAVTKPLSEHVSIVISKGSYLLGNIVDEVSSEARGALFAIFNFIQNYKTNAKIAKAFGDDISLKELFSHVDYPMVVLDQDGIVNLLNDKFSSLSILPSTLIEHREIGWLEYQSERYKILNESINERFCLYTLVKQNSEVEHSIEGQSELGIISGSIAHELNNPVAGILAAITLLELEEWDDENITALKEMKDSGLRCKGLIDTFLGFSRYRGIGPVVKGLGIVLEQSTSLLRYRIVESGLTINVSIEDELSCRKIKASVMPMVFYLLFNEILTILSHKLLLDKSLGKVLNLKFEESENELWIINESYSYDNEDLKKFDIKLIDHLMEMEKMRLLIEDGIIKIIGIYDD